MDSNVNALQQFEISAEEDEICIVCLSFVSSLNGIEDGIESL